MGEVLRTRDQMRPSRHILGGAADAASRRAREPAGRAFLMRSVRRGFIACPVGRADRQIAWLTFAAAIVAGATALAGCQQARPRPAASGPAAARIVSFSPAITQILFDMDLGGQVVGVTSFCRLPPGQGRPRLGDALNISAEAILAVQPDVIFTQSGPERFSGVREIDPRVRVEQLELERLADIPAAIDRIGQVVGRSELAAETRTAFTLRLESIRARTADLPGRHVDLPGRQAGLARPRVLMVMGMDRPTVAGSDNFIDDLIDLAGGRNAGADIPGVTRWRPTQIEAILRAAPDVLICQVADARQGPEARQYWLGWKDLPAAKAGRVYIVSDPDWSIPSTRLAGLARELAEMIHPGAMAPDGSAPATVRASGVSQPAAAASAPAGQATPLSPDRAIPRPQGPSVMRPG